MSTEPDDLALWGATEADELIGALPQVRRIGEKLFVRVPGAEPGTAVRLPLRLSVDLMRRAIEAGDGVDQTGYVIDEVGDEAFFKIMTTWAADNALANATTDDFLNLVESSDGADTRRLVEAWLTNPEPP